MKVVLNDWVGALEHPIYFRVAAQRLGITHETLKKLSDRLGFPAHYRNIPFPDKPWCHYRIRVCYPSELLVFRAIRQPEFRNEVDVPDWLGRAAGFSPAEAQETTAAP